MTKWTDAKLKREATNEYHDCYECGYYPDWTDGTLSNDELEMWANEYDMTVSEFKKYMNYFLGYIE